MLERINVKTLWVVVAIVVVFGIIFINAGIQDEVKHAPHYPILN